MNYNTVWSILILHMFKLSDISNKQKKLLISNVLLILAVLLLVGGIIYLSVDIYNRHKREAVIEDAATNMDQVIAQNAAAIEAAGGDDSAVAEPVMTLIVDPSELEVNGEEYDFYDDDYYIQQALNSQRNQVNQEMNDAYTGYLTLQGVGMLDIPCIDLHVPIWETTNSDTLRYGVGHYVNSVSPGAVGNCTITGHHMLKYGSIFNRLEEVGIGDIINITDLLGHQYTYFVDEIQVVTAEEMLNHVAGGLTDTRQVTLITCVYTDTGKMRLLVIGHIQDGT